MRAADRWGRQLLVIAPALLLAHKPVRAEVTLNDPRSRAGYVALLLINEAPFPGERHYVSVADSKASMLQILWVLHNRVSRPPAGYSEDTIAMVTSSDVIDAIVAGGRHGQVEGFYRAADGTPQAVPRVHQRLNRLLEIANSGPPGKFAELLDYAKHLGEAYFASGPDDPNLFATLRRINSVKVTGSAYSWMTDEAHVAPGGTYVRIPDADRGGLGGNRFFTLRARR